MELYCNFFDHFCGVNKLKELKIDANSRDLALAGEDLDEGILPSKRAEWIEKRSKDCRDNFRADAKNYFSPALAALNIRKTKRENQECSRGSSNVLKFCACGVKIVAVTIVKVKSLAVKD